MLVLILIAFVLLACATYLFYLAAFGHPSERREIDTAPKLGLADRILEEQKRLAGESLSRMEKGLVLTFLGIFVMVTVFAIDMFIPEQPKPVSRLSTLVSMNDELDNILLLRNKFDKKSQEYSELKDMYDEKKTGSFRVFDSCNSRRPKRGNGSDKCNGIKQCTASILQCTRE